MSDMCDKVDHLEKFDCKKNDMKNLVVRQHFFFQLDSKIPAKDMFS